MFTLMDHDETPGTHGTMTYGEVIPEPVLSALDEYARTGRGTGSFMHALLEGDLFRTVNRADPRTVEALPAIVKYVQNRLPLGCFGSEKKVTAWVNAGGLIGQGYSDRGDNVWTKAQT